MSLSEAELYKRMNEELQRRKILKRVRNYLEQQMAASWGKRYLWYLGGIELIDRVRLRG